MPRTDPSANENLQLAIATHPVEIQGLVRRFGKRVALAGIDLAVGEGEVVGLVGPNGSGKTTLLSLVAGFLRPHAGQVRVFGWNPASDAPRILERTRFAFAPPAFFPELSAREQLRFLTAIRRRNTPRVSWSDIDAALDVVGLSQRSRDRVGTFSLGMKQRLALAQALLPRPDLIVLDEPTEGLDPLAVLDLRSALTNLSAEFGTSILLSSHLMIEVEQLVDRLLVLREGSTLFYGTPRELIVDRERLRLGVAAPQLENARRALAESGHTATLAEGQLELAPAAISLTDADSILRAAGISLESYGAHRPTLEEALLIRLRSSVSAPGQGEAQ